MKYALLVAALGCSRPAPVAPTAPAPILSGVYQVTVSETHEISCSRSFERDDEIAGYELTIREDNSATLAVVLISSSVFGPSSSKFTNGPANRKERRRRLRFVGRANGATTFSGAEERSGMVLRLDCKPLVDAISCTGLPFLPRDKGLPQIMRR